MSCGVGHRQSLDPMLLWLRCRPAATAPVGPLAWELPHAAGTALQGEDQKKKKGCLKCLGAFRLLPEMRTLFCQLSPGASLVQEPSFSRLPRVTQIPSPNHAILLGSERPWTHAEYNCAAIHTHSRKRTACELKFLAASGGSKMSSN